MDSHPAVNHGSSMMNNSKICYSVASIQRNHLQHEAVLEPFDCDRFKSMMGIVCGRIGLYLIKCRSEIPPMDAKMSLSIAAVLEVLHLLYSAPHGRSKINHSVFRFSARTFNVPGWPLHAATRVAQS